MQLDPAQWMNINKTLCCGASSLEAAAFFNQGERGSGNVAIEFQNKKRRKKERGTTRQSKISIGKVKQVTTSIH
jgi:hypothetical protein